MKTYHMYHTESISAESKLKDAEKQEEKQFSKSGDLNVNLLRHEDRQPRRSSVRKIEKMKEKVSMPKLLIVLCFFTYYIALFSPFAKNSKSSVDHLDV